MAKTVRDFVKNSLNSYYKNFQVKMGANADPSIDNVHNAIRIANDGSIYIHDAGGFDGYNDNVQNASTLQELLKRDSGGGGTPGELIAGNALNIETNKIIQIGYIQRNDSARLSDITDITRFHAIDGSDLTKNVYLYKISPEEKDIPEITKTIHFDHLRGVDLYADEQGTIPLGKIIDSANGDGKVIVFSLQSPASNIPSKNDNPAFIKCYCKKYNLADDKKVIYVTSHLYNTSLNGCAFGSDNFVYAQDGFAQGNHNTINETGVGSHVEGYNNSVDGYYSHAEGEQTIIEQSSNCSHTEGYKTKASSDYAHAEGEQTHAVAVASHTEGYNTISNGEYSHAEGDNTNSNGDYSHAEGNNTLASGDYSHTEGRNTNSNGESSHAEGYDTETSGDYSHTEGEQTKSEGRSSHAEGGFTKAVGIYAHAEGYSDLSSTRRILVSAAVEERCFIKDEYHRYSHKCLVFDKLPEMPNSFIGCVIKNVYPDNLYRQYSGNVTRDTEYVISNYRINDNESAHIVLGDITVSFKGNDGTIYSDVQPFEGDGHLGDLYIYDIIANANGVAAHSEGWSTIAGSEASHSEGIFTEAIARGSHTEGYRTQSWGESSHAEGFHTTTTSKGDYAHAEGYYTEVSGNYSHAEGCNTVVKGNGSHAEGYGTEASGEYAHAEGYNTEASGEYSHAEGVSWNTLYYWTARTVNVRQSFGELSGYEYFFACSSNLGNGERMFLKTGNFMSLIRKNDYVYKTQNGGIYFNTTKNLPLPNNNENNSLTAPFVLYTADNEHAIMPKAIGNGSHTEGIYTEASGEYAHAEGGWTEASGYYAHAEGEGNTARGDGAHAEGYYTEASGKYSHTEGYNTYATNECAHSEGYNVYATGKYSHAEGIGEIRIPGTYKSTAGSNKVIANGDVDNLVLGVGLELIYDNQKYTVTGYGYNYNADGSIISTYITFDKNFAKNNNYVSFICERGGAFNTAAHSEGGCNIARGEYSHAEGIFTESSGRYSHSEGLCTKAHGNTSHTEGKFTEASGQYSHAEGHETNAKGHASHTEGYYTIVESSGNYSHAEGESTIVYGYASHTEGYETEASGNYAHAEGQYTKAYENAAHAEGKNTEARGPYSHTEGSWEYYSKTIYNALLNIFSYNNPHYEYGKSWGNNQFDYKISQDSFNPSDDSCITIVLTTPNHFVNLYDFLKSKFTYNGHTYTIVYFDSAYMNSFDTTYAEYGSSDEYFDSRSHDQRHHSDQIEYTNDINNDEQDAIILSDVVLIDENGNVAEFLDSTIFEESISINTHPTGYVKGIGSHAEGGIQTIAGKCSHAEGLANQVLGDYAHAEGYSNKVLGNYAHAEGRYNVATGVSAHVSGIYSNAYGNNSHAMGEGLVAYAGQVVIGKWNIKDTTKKYAFIIGNGTSDIARSNAFAVTWTGEIITSNF